MTEIEKTEQVAILFLIVIKSAAYYGISNNIIFSIFKRFILNTQFVEN